MLQVTVCKQYVHKYLNWLLQYQEYSFTDKITTQSVCRGIILASENEVPTNSKNGWHLE